MALALASPLPLYKVPVGVLWPADVHDDSTDFINAVIEQVTETGSIDIRTWCQSDPPAAEDGGAAAGGGGPAAAAAAATPEQLRAALYKWIAYMISGTSNVPDTPNYLKTLKLHNINGTVGPKEPRIRRVKCIGADLAHDIEYYIHGFVLPYYRTLGIVPNDDVFTPLEQMAADDKKIIIYYDALSGFNDNDSLGIYNYEGAGAASVTSLREFLAEKSCNSFLLDAWYTNLYEKGLGSATTIHYDPTVSRIDGGSKVLSGNTNGSQLRSMYGGFSVPFFYENMEHVLNYNKDTKTASIAVYKNAALQFTAICKSGFSVNACCMAAGRAKGPRKEGTAGSPITIVYAPGISLTNEIAAHIDLIKSITDWASLIFIKYMYVVYGIIIALITNDRFCLRMAKYLRLPFAISTPSTYDKHCELFCFDKAVLQYTPDQIDIIRSKLARIEEANNTNAIALANEFRIADPGNDFIITAWNREIDGIVADLNAMMATLIRAKTDSAANVASVGISQYIIDGSCLLNTADIPKLFNDICKSKLMIALDKFKTFKLSIRKIIIEYKAGAGDKRDLMNDIISTARGLVPSSNIEKALLYKNIFPAVNIMGYLNNEAPMLDGDIPLYVAYGDHPPVGGAVPYPFYSDTIFQKIEKRLKIFIETGDAGGGGAAVAAAAGGGAAAPGGGGGGGGGEASAAVAGDGGTEAAGGGGGGAAASATAAENIDPLVLDPLSAEEVSAAAAGGGGAAAAPATLVFASAPQPAAPSHKKRPSLFRGERKHAAWGSPIGGVLTRAQKKQILYNVVQSGNRYLLKQYGGGLRPNNGGSEDITYNPIALEKIHSSIVLANTKGTAGTGDTTDNDEQCLMGEGYINILFSNFELDIIFLLDLLDALSEDADACNYNPSYETELENLYALLELNEYGEISDDVLMLEVLYVLFCTPVIEIIRNGLTPTQLHTIIYLSDQMLKTAAYEYVAIDPPLHADIPEQAKTEARSKAATCDGVAQLDDARVYWQERHRNEFLALCHDLITSDSNYANAGNDAWYNYSVNDPPDIHIPGSPVNPTEEDKRIRTTEVEMLLKGNKDFAKNAGSLSANARAKHALSAEEMDFLKKNRLQLRQYINESKAIIKQTTAYLSNPENENISDKDMLNIRIALYKEKIKDAENLLDQLKYNPIETVRQLMSLKKGGARKTRKSRKHKKTRKANNRKYNRRTRRKHH